MRALFAQYDLRGLLDERRQDALRDVGAASPTQLRADVELHAAQLWDAHRLRPVLLTEGATSVEAVEASIDRRTLPGLDHGFRGGPASIDGFRVIYTVPLTGDVVLLDASPSNWSTSHPYGAVSSSTLRLSYEVLPDQVGATRARFDQDLAEVKRWLGWVNGDVEQFNNELRATILQEVNRRAARLLEAERGVETLGIPVRRKIAHPIDADLAPPAKVVGEPPAVASMDRYDVALSFAGEQRDYVRAVAEALRGAGVRVFFHEFETVALWGKDLVAHLQDIYQNRARFCVVFVSTNYVAKAWPSHERRSAQARALVAREEYLLPVRFDDTALPGLQPTIGYVDLRGTEATQLAEMIVTKLGKRMADA